MKHFKSAIIFWCAFIPLLTFTKLCHGLDSLIPNQTLVIGQTLISPNQIFEMGFFTPGSSKNRFLGIWYKFTPNVVVWVANRNNPITDSQGVHLAIVGNKSLTVMSARGIIWFSEYTWVALDPILQLLDTGNLVLVDKADENLLQRYIWQSFDHPTDTLLPGMKIVDDIDAGVERYLTSWRNSDDPSPGDFIFKIQNQGLPDTLLLHGKKKVFRTGTWNGLYFSGSAPFTRLVFEPKLVFKEEKLISMSLPYDSSTFRRITLDKSGKVHLLALNARKDDWNPVTIKPLDPCEEYGKCGPFGICILGMQIKCQCLKGFAPKSQKDWDLQDWSGGCNRITKLNCESGDHGFLEVAGINYPDMLQFWLNTSMSLGECKQVCLSNCSCIAYANPFINTGRIGCLMWFGELIDTRYLPRADNKQKIYIRLPRSELDSVTSLEVGNGKDKPVIFILISIISGVVVSCFINGGIHYMGQQMKQNARREETHEDLELPLYRFSIVMAATNNFSKENLIGEGGFGIVYKGNLSTGVEIAVKRLSTHSKQGHEEFKNEAMLIAKLQHKNLVRLLGCCIEREERMLIYEYMENKSLDIFIFDQNRRILLSWPKRYGIIIGIAKGLLYLHHDSRLKVIHRDLKTNNILLDGNLNARISDFGLGRIFKEDQSTVTTRRVVGTFGYMSPEYAFAGKLSTKSDIFSLGVVLLEVVSGKKNRDSVEFYSYYSLLGHAWLLWKENKTLELMDECLKDTFIESQVKRCVHVGLLCVQKDLEDRPDMISVFSMLTSNETILPEPKEPGFFIETSPEVARSYSSVCANFESGTVSITDLEGR